ncbi:MAG: HAD hydrolase family protein [Armatimonadetes bacterium]|nr:HAD hydrolase family protein [Armatimonadota bacterium]
MPSSPEFSFSALSSVQPMREIEPQRWGAIQLLCCDVDGVLTDGSLAFDENGSLIQTFYVRDGFGLVAARRAGIKIAWISGRPSKVAQKRFEELGLDHCLLACDDKAAAILDLQSQYGFSPDQCCFIGDDIPDLSAFTVCGLRVAVADAEPVLISRADYITRARGGRGAVREIIDLMLSARGYWDLMLDMFENSDQAAPDNLQK